MSNITEVIFTTDSNNNLDLESNFVYNYYISNERTINDNLIKESNSSKKYRYIELNVLNEINSMNYIIGEDINYTNVFAEESDLQEKLLEFSLYDNLLINENDYFFNKINNFDKDKSFFYNETTKSNLNKSLKSYYNINIEDNIDYIIDTVSNNNKSFIRNSILSVANELEKNHIFPSSNELNIYENYNKIFNSSYYKKIYNNNPYESLRSGIVLNNFNKLFTLNIDQVPDKFITKCGFYICKYVKRGNEYENIAEKFIYERSYSTSNNKYSLNFKDESINYGKTYLYTVSEVFIYRSKSIDGVNLDYHIICDYPYISEDIVCIEKEAPLCPNGPYFEYDNKLNNLNISWFPQSNDQNDVLGFQVLKRNSLEEPYVVIAQIEGHRESETFERKEFIQSDSIIRNPGEIKTSYIDKTFDKEKISIYTIRSIDAHGNLSLYSTQVAVYYNLFEDKLIIDLISRENAPISKPNTFIPRKTIFFDNEDFTITNTPIINNKRKFSLYLTPDFVKLQDYEENESNKYILDEKYKFSLFNLNTYSTYEEEFTIQNFNIEEDT